MFTVRFYIMSKKSSLFLIFNLIVLFSPHFLSASTNQSSFDEDGEKTALSRFYSLVKRQHQRSHESVVKQKTSLMGTFEKHKRAFQG